jgi:hypothetical protein
MHRVQYSTIEIESELGGDGRKRERASQCFRFEFPPTASLLLALFRELRYAWAANSYLESNRFTKRLSRVEQVDSTGDISFCTLQVVSPSIGSTVAFIHFHAKSR